MREAVSMAINREQVALIGEGGVVQPADVTGITSLYAPWKVSDPASLSDWTTCNVDKANELLDAAGLTRGADGIRVLPDGTPMNYSVAVLPAPNWLAAPAHPYTQLLMSAVPDPHTGFERTVQARCEVPSLVDPPPGCPFALRCPRVMDVCRHAMPGPTTVVPDHWVKCHLYGDGALSAA